MKIGNTNVKISAVGIAVALIFAFFLLFRYYIQQDLYVLAWGVPMLAMLIVIPIGLNYMSQSSYLDVIPEYEREAKKVRVKAINPQMLGQAVPVEGGVERALFQYLNRPQYLVADSSGEISVKMFTTPQEKVVKGDLVEVLGQVMKRYVFTGEPVINCVRIRKIERIADADAPPKKKKK
jgi:hypothetical protein